MARARRLAAAGAATAFVVAGLSLATALTPAAATVDPGSQQPGTASTCLLPLPLLCEDDTPTPSDSWSSAPGHDDSWSSEPTPTGSWPETVESVPPWRPAGEREHRVPRGHPETGGGAFAADAPTWPFALGGAALLTGAGLTGFAVRRRRNAA
ncbi:hypothetical protein [Nonomuraea insulae]|uniref:Gram-positive cocci surface proteins LPxTG domain-containing protein n=1 Tax=Nonomuraea insulae TaxID=1616787 RepID=A0ABW1CW94_9ACTN